LIPKVPFEEDPTKESNIAPLVDPSWDVFEEDTNGTLELCEKYRRILDNRTPEFKKEYQKKLVYSEA